MNLAAAVFDRRIAIQEATDTRDAAGDVIQTDWAPPAGWPLGGKRWAGKRDFRPQEQGGNGSTQVLLRQVDTVFTLRFDRYSSTIAPETFRVVYKGRPYEIVGLGEGKAREDGLELLCSSRPDQRGPVSPDGASGQP